ncbi:hypothetical protein PTKIN_Ptkin07bG0285400 [Pterospermum kingtungense]
MDTLSCSPNYTYARRSPIRLGSGWSASEKYVMRQRYLRSYPLIMTNNKKEKFAEKVAKKSKQWLKEKKRKYCRLEDDDDEDDDYDDQEEEESKQPGGDDKKPKHKLGSWYVKACLKLLLVCVSPKVDGVVGMEDPKKTLLTK